jgi:hypothetical protein
MRPPLDLFESFAIDCPPNLLPLLAEFSLKIRQIVQVMGRLSGLRDTLQCQRRLGSNQVRHYSKIFLNIRGEMKSPTWAKDAFALHHEIVRENTALLVPCLPPRVREINMHRLNGVVRNKVPQKHSCVATRQTHVSQAALDNPRGGIELVLAFDLDAEEIDVRPLLRFGEKKQSFAKPKFAKISPQRIRAGPVGSVKRQGASSSSGRRFKRRMDHVSAGRTTPLG